MTVDVTFIERPIFCQPVKPEYSRYFDGNLVTSEIAARLQQWKTAQSWLENELQLQRDNFQTHHDLVRRFAAIRRCRIQNLQSKFSRTRY